jgi:hypothetical protein
MPYKPSARLRGLIDELSRARTESGQAADEARRELTAILRNRDLTPATAAQRPPRRKAGRKKR